MRTGRIIIIGFIVLGAVVMLAAAANLIRQQVVHEPLVDSRNIFIHDSYTLSDSVDDTLFVMAQKITLEADSHVAGDAALIGESITVDGQVDGDLTATGSSLHIGADSSVDGDVMLVGSSITLNGRIDGDVVVTGSRLSISPDAQVEGDLVACVDNITDERSSSVDIRHCGDSGTPTLLGMLKAFGSHKSFIVSADDSEEIDPAALLLLSAIITTPALIVLSALGVTVFPRQISRIEEALQTQPRHLLITGVMALLAAVGVGSAYVVVLASVPPIGLLLLPVVALLVLGGIGLILAGLMTLSLVFGTWLLRRISGQEQPPLIAALVGSLLLMLLLHGLAALPFGAPVSLVLLALLCILAVGAALTTRVGTRPLRQSYFVQG